MSPARSALSYSSSSRRTISSTSGRTASANRTIRTRPSGERRTLTEDRPAMTATVPSPGTRTLKERSGSSAESSPNSPWQGMPAAEKSVMASSRLAVPAGTSMHSSERTTQLPTMARKACSRMPWPVVQCCSAILRSAEPSMASESMCRWDSVMVVSLLFHHMPGIGPADGCHRAYIPCLCLILTRGLLVCEGETERALPAAHDGTAGRGVPPSGLFSHVLSFYAR